MSADPDLECRENALSRLVQFLLRRRCCCGKKQKDEKIADLFMENFGSDDHVYLGLSQIRHLSFGCGKDGITTNSRPRRLAGAAQGGGAVEELFPHGGG